MNSYKWVNLDLTISFVSLENIVKSSFIVNSRLIYNSTYNRRLQKNIGKSGFIVKSIIVKLRSDCILIVQSNLNIRNFSVVGKTFLISRFSLY